MMVDTCFFFFFFHVMDDYCIEPEVLVFVFVDVIVCVL